MTTEVLQAQFNKNKEYEQLKYDMEKLSRENLYLREQLNEENLKEEKNENFKSKTISTLEMLSETFNERLERVSEVDDRSNSYLMKIIGSIILELENIDLKYMNKDVLERLVAIKAEIENLFSEKNKNLSLTVNDMSKLVMELVENLKS